MSVQSEEIGAAFIKGMTLEEYLMKLDVKNEQQGVENQSDDQQNLYESSRPKHKGRSKPINFNFDIKQLDQESCEDQKDDPEKLQDKQKTSNTFLKTKESMQHQNQPNSFFLNKKQAMNLTAYNPRLSLEKDNLFRIKQQSKSPVQKQKESHSLHNHRTLYGSNFYNNKLKQGPNKANLEELVINLQNKKLQKEKMLPQVRKQEKSLKKKNNLNIEELIHFENNIRNNFSQKIYLKDMRVDGLKDKLMERKTKMK